MQKRIYVRLIFYGFFLYRVLGQKCVSGERWKNFNRKLAKFRVSVLDFTVMQWGGGGGGLRMSHVMWGYSWCSPSSQKLTCLTTSHRLNGAPAGVFVPPFNPLTRVRVSVGEALPPARSLHSFALCHRRLREALRFQMFS